MALLKIGISLMLLISVANASANELGLSEAQINSLLSPKAVPAQQRTQKTPKVAPAQQRIEKAPRAEPTQQRVEKAAPKIKKKVVATLSNSRIKEALIKQSIAYYSGNCPCPYNRASNGSRCGKRSAYSRPRGASPLCYTSDITEQMVSAYKARQ